MTSPAFALPPRSYHKGSPASAVRATIPRVTRRFQAPRRCIGGAGHSRRRIAELKVRRGTGSRIRRRTLRWSSGNLECASENLQGDICAIPIQISGPARQALFLFWPRSLVPFPPRSPVDLSALSAVSASRPFRDRASTFPIPDPASTNRVARAGLVRLREKKKLPSPVPSSSGACPGRIPRCPSSPGTPTSTTLVASRSAPRARRQWDGFGTVRI